MINDLVQQPALLLRNNKTPFYLSVHRYKRGLLSVFAVCFCLLFMSGCAGVKVRSVSPADQSSLRRGYVLTTGKLSASSQEVLRVVGFDVASCQKDAENCREILHTSGGLTDEQRLSTLAELRLQVALTKDKNLNRHKNNQRIAVADWLETARYAYAYLFFTERKPGERAFEDRQTQVRDYYNYAIQQAITYVYRQHLKTGQTDPAKAPVISGWETKTDLSALDTPSDSKLPVEMIPAQSLSFSGIRNVYRRDGFGTDLIAVEPRSARKGANEASKNRRFRETPFSALTVLIQFDGNNLQEVLATQKLKIVLFNPYKTSSITISGQNIPLSANFTAGYGLWLARSNFATQALRNLFGRTGGITQAQIYLMQPYDPNRRVIVMLHGLASSPEAWINLANEVLGDETLRQNYQIWQVYYPTNAPLALNNKDIRQALEQTLKHFDPAGKARASGNITLVGHSMGGVLSRLMISTADDTALLDTYLQEYPMSQKEETKARSELTPYLSFTPLPQVSDTIFIASPHRGTSFANNKVARWIANLISLPPTMLSRLTKGTLAPPYRIPNSIDNLSDKDLFVQMTADLPISPQVQYHSIIGNYTPKASLEDSTDGVVPYKSAHLKDTCSELVIDSFHSVQEKPQAILEIRRILKEQLVGQIDCNKKIADSK